MLSKCRSKAQRLQRLWELDVGQGVVKSFAKSQALELRRQWEKDRRIETVTSRRAAEQHWRRAVAAVAFAPGYTIFTN